MEILQQATFEPKVQWTLGLPINFLDTELVDDRQLPAANKAMRYRTEPLEGRHPGPAGDTWVAIIDDHQSVRSCLARVMRLEGIPAAVFASAEEYLDHQAPMAPSCLVLDMQLPGMSGYTLAQLLERERPPLPPIIFISAHEGLLASVEDDRLTHGTLRKPFEMDDLLALVKPLL